MKYISSACRTQLLLNRWAGSTPLTIANFFFWYLGSPEQKSQEGLSRALLFKVLDSDHSLIPTLLPMTWQEAYGTDANISLPSPAEMQSAFERLGHAHLRRRRFCFFIDGLDEYSGKPADGVNFLRGLAMNSNIKIIVSSRPIPACVQYFSKQPKLYLQDLTYSDIETYVHQTVGSHPHMDTLRSSNLAQATQLGIDLVQKASGVFLWVVLACRSLLEGFANFDRWSDLQRRIDELPVELENLFQHMLCKVEVRYQADAAKFLKICHQNRIVPGVKRLSTLGLALVDDYDMDLTQTPAFPSMTNSEKHAKCSILDGRLRSRCCGLIEIRSYHDRVHDNCFCKDGYHPADSHDPLIDSTVEFMHRSVFDFLSTQSFVDLEIRIKDEAQESDANAVLACISMHLVSFSLGKIDQGRGYVRDLVMYSVHTEFVSYQSMAGIFARLQRVISNSGSTKLPLFVFDKIDKGVVSDLQRSDSYLGLLLATEAGIIHFLQAYEIGEKERLSKTSLTFPLLYYAVKQPLLTYLDVGRPHGLTQNESVIKYLLSVGCDPNESFERGSRKNTTPWEEFLYESDYHGTEHSYNTVDILLRGGADPEISNGLAKRLARKKQNAEILQCIQKYESELALRGDIEEVDHNDPVQAPHLAPTKGRHHDSLVQSSRSFPAFSSATGKKRARSLSPTNISKKTNFGRI